MSTEMTRLRTVVVDDEDLARSLLREYLAQHDDVDVVAECANGFEAVKAIIELAPDLVFLDVQMPKLSGFEVLELVGAEVNVVFVTAFDEFALRAFEINAVDYLLKPFDAARLEQALGRARQRLGQGRPASHAGLLASVRQAGAYADRVLVRDGPKVHVLPVGTIDYIEAADDWIVLHRGTERLRKPQTLAEVAGTLDPARFVRIHRSYLLNVERLARIELYAKDSRVAILADGTKLPLSRAGNARLRQLL